ncbi:DUF2189 domain-containing protein [Xanthobacter dioxanivorans]|uniref:DUF2189 domain-containing protein n=2 Tax=Xanthobacter dioxanivorans TaxID=2528964 RepID=A0A974PTY0_9HYPH|nr:DUF2189 domain-containing protein [Xanthobacter dioxanivorans]QRG09707.1 DUF2189 domain-containing protein [Xanthobacter dioxanivorans]
MPFIDADAALRVRHIGPEDLVAALRAGVADFRAHPSQLFFLMLIYPLVGLFLARLAFNHDVLPLLYPLVAGFAFLGPIAAVGLYEVSRRREAGLPHGLRYALEVRHAPTFGAIAMIGFVLMVIFLVWLVAAMGVYRWTYGAYVPHTLASFLSDVTSTRHGLKLVIAGNAVGLLFGLLAMAVSVVSLPLLVDRPVTLACALRTSFRAVAVNFWTMLLWGMIVAAALAAGSLPFFIGLAVVLPILGHATWHLYRRLVP